MLTGTSAKLLDFGLAKPAAQLTSPATLTAAATQDFPMTEWGTIVGTFQYMSPEQVEGKERRTAGRARKHPAPDKWSIAEIVVHMADTEVVFGYIPADQVASLAGNRGASRLSA